MMNSLRGTRAGAIVFGMLMGVVAGYVTVNPHEARAVRQDGEHADYFSDQAMTNQVGAETWGCGGGHLQSGTVPDSAQNQLWIIDGTWPCDFGNGSSYCLYGYRYWVAGQGQPVWYGNQCPGQ